MNPKQQGILTKVQVAVIGFVHDKARVDGCTVLIYPNGGKTGKDNHG